jgi:hypothetical protein
MDTAPVRCQSRKSVYRRFEAPPADSKGNNRMKPIFDDEDLRSSFSRIAIPRRTGKSHIQIARVD